MNDTEKLRRRIADSAAELLAEGKTAGCAVRIAQSGELLLSAEFGCTSAPVLTARAAARYASAVAVGCLSRIAHRLAASDKADAETGVLAGKLGQRSAEEYILAEGVGVISGAYGAGNIYAYLACLRGQCHCGLSASRAAQHEPVSRNGECSRYSEYRFSAVRTAVGYCCFFRIQYHLYSTVLPRELLSRC